MFSNREFKPYVDVSKNVAGQAQNILELLAMPEAAVLDFEIEREIDLPRKVDLS